jgi:N-acyl homoserine lactone hydrolase
MTLHKVPSFDFDKEQTAKSRAAMEAFVQQTRAQLWIQHDAVAGAKRKLAPEYYE